MTDPRQPAYDAVFTFIRSQPRDFMPLTVVDRNAMIWHAVHAALDAMGVPGPEGVGASAATEATEPGNLREQIAAAMLRTLRRHGEMPTPDAIRLIDEFAVAVLAVVLPATRITATLARMSEADVQRVITVTEAGPPSGMAIPGEWEHGWDAAMDAVRKAITPIKEQRERPTHPDGTPYRYAEIVAEGWGYCDGCRMWSTGTPQRPHQCAQTHMRAASKEPS